MQRPIEKIRPVQGHRFFKSNVFCKANSIESELSSSCRQICLQDLCTRRTWAALGLSWHGFLGRWPSSSGIRDALITDLSILVVTMRQQPSFISLALAAATGALGPLVVQVDVQCHFLYTPAELYWVSWAGKVSSASGKTAVLKEGG